MIIRQFYVFYDTNNILITNKNHFWLNIDKLGKISSYIYVYINMDIYEFIHE